MTMSFKPPISNRRFVQESPLSYDRQARTVDAVLSNGSPVQRFFGTEILSTKREHVDLDRLKTSGIPLLDSHQIMGISSLLGRVEDIRFEKGQIVGRLRFGDTDEARKAEGMVARGELTGVSIGYNVAEWEVTDGQGNKRDPDREILSVDDQLTFTATRWALMEASLVTVPADAGARTRALGQTIKDIAMDREELIEVAGSAIRVTETDDERIKREEEEARARAADDKDDKDDSADDKDDKDKDKRAVKRLVPALSRAAVVELAQIDRQARNLNIDLNLEDAIATGEKPDTMRKRLFEALAAKSKQTGPVSSTGPNSMQVTRDENEGKRESMELALATRILGDNYAPKRKAEQRFVETYKDQARQYEGMGFVELAAECIGYRGNIRNGAMASMIIDEAFKPGSTSLRTRAFQSTSDYPAIFLNALNKVLLARYEYAVPTYRSIAVERPFTDFRPHPQIRAGDFPVPQAVAETGELRVGASTDLQETLSVLPYGVIFSISRQMLVNDELGAIDQIIGSAGDTVGIWENETFFKMFNSNSLNGPTLVQDSLTVFHATHVNLAGTGAAPSVTTVGAARQALRQMTSMGGHFLNIPPAIILGGPVQETVIDTMVMTIAPTLTTSVNPFSGRLRAISDANITDKSWYIMAEPSRLPVFAYGFLNGASGPRIRTFEPFGYQGIKMSLELDFGCGAIDFRGAYRSPTY